MGIGIPFNTYLLFIYKYNMDLLLPNGSGAEVLKSLCYELNPIYQSAIHPIRSIPVTSIHIFSIGII